MHLTDDSVWRAMRMEVNGLADRLGLGIDEEIKEVVVALRVYGLPTSQSCGGHGTGFPWVEIYSCEPSGWKDREDVKLRWRLENTRHQKFLMELLAKFYRARETPFDARIVFEQVGIFGGFRIRSFGASLWPLLSPGQKKQKSRLYLNEMRDFADFLRHKWYARIKVVRNKEEDYV